MQASSTGSTSFVPDQNPDEGQVFNSGDTSQASSDSSALQNTYYYYDPLNGTRLKCINSALTVAGFSVAGAAGMKYMTSQLSGIAERGDSVFERVVEYAEKTCFEHPLVVGAGLGAVSAACLIKSVCQNSLKPRSAEVIRPIMHNLIHQIAKSCQNITQYKTVIENNEVMLAAKQAAMLAEKAENGRRAEEIFNQNMQAYHHKAGKVAGELEGYLGAVFDRLAPPADRLPTYTEAVHGANGQGSYQLGLEVSRFLRSDHSYWSRQRLKEALTPHLTRHELDKVNSILAKFPWKPTKLSIVGPIEREYNNIKGEIRVNTGQVGTLQEKVRFLSERYPILAPDPEGRVKTPSIAEFRDFLPE